MDWIGNVFPTANFHNSQQQGNGAPLASMFGGGAAHLPIANFHVSGPAWGGLIGFSPSPATQVQSNSSPAHATDATAGVVQTGAAIPAAAFGGLNGFF
jgi:hypothetical protein